MDALRLTLECMWTGWDVFFTKCPVFAQSQRCVIVSVAGASGVAVESGVGPGRARDGRSASLSYTFVWQVLPDT